MFDRHIKGKDCGVPRMELSTRHIENGRLILNRTEMLKRLQKNQICAEIGVDKGEFTSKIIRYTTPKKLHLIDSWNDPPRYHQGLAELVKGKYATQIKKRLVEVNIGDSVEVLKEFEDEYFNWVYLDTDHSYTRTASELMILNLKVKRDGFILGHDYTLGNWDNNFMYGVIEAVNEFCIKYNWEFIYFTMEPNRFNSFCIRRISSG